MKHLLTLVLAFCIVQATAQEKVIKAYHETQEDNSLIIYVENRSEVLHSVLLEGNLKGMSASIALPITQVVPPKSTTAFVTLTPTANSYGYSYEFTSTQGDVTAIHDDTYVYQLPYQSGESHRIDQGYLERPTHMDQYALDFHMDTGTKICAIRDGKVMNVVQKHNRGCPDKSCGQYNNFVQVMHADGSIADYSHLQKNGALVKIGDEVKAGDVIALSGATGQASGPHLHLEVYVMRFSGSQSVEASYQLDASTVGIPQTGKSYTKP
ncbi:M23 family metallopeptidase [Marinoscillum furvescens]|uniref:Peptidase M23-like protein n=1 Tax=Marinoscillum furvescens DSM 4134 TaxID=1122208 RepID=A0A3D9KWK5_MARFU|nr:M23 family metallopeptidase [Marinoscillum furvescens]RED91585.1 peptidase M23-like protein [Marinoscillum furvescens DSM 4134]